MSKILGSDWFNLIWCCSKGWRNRQKRVQPLRVYLPRSAFGLIHHVSPTRVESDGLQAAIGDSDQGRNAPMPRSRGAIAYESTVSFAFIFRALILHLPATCPALPGLRNEGQARPRVGAVRASLRTTLWRSRFQAGRSQHVSATRPPLGWVGLGPVLVAPCGCRAGRNGDGEAMDLGRDWGLARMGETEPQAGFP